MGFVSRRFSLLFIWLLFHAVFPFPLYMAFVSCCFSLLSYMGFVSRRFSLLFIWLLFHAIFPFPLCLAFVSSRFPFPFIFLLIFYSYLNMQEIFLNTYYMT